MAKKVKRRVGEAKGQSGIGKQWISYPREMVESPALRVRSRPAIMAMHRLEAEHMAHGAADNGNLIVTRRQFEEWGVHKNYVSQATRELEALGFAEVCKGHAGVGGHGKANRYRLTYVNDKHGVEPTHEWNRIDTIEEAEQIASQARSDKDRRSRDLGARGGRVTQQKKKSASVSSDLGLTNCSRKSNHEASKTEATMFRPHKWRPLSISRTGGGGSADG